MKARVGKYNEAVEVNPKAHSLLDFSCDLNRMNNTEDSKFGEDGLECNR